jgi:predicted dehydrogenase
MWSTINMRFEDDSTASFTMTAFTAMRQRETQIFGTKGEIRGNSETIEIYDFLSETKEVIDTTKALKEGALSGHGGGDGGIMTNFVDAVAHNDPSRIRSGARESLETHLMVFAAERARREGRVVKVEL